MAKVTILFWDVGGVILTNGWGRASRLQAAEKYGLDWAEFDARHETAIEPLERGQMGLDEYMEKTVFYCPRLFTKQDFRKFILAQSQPNPEVLTVLQRLAASKLYLLATLNNESLELNQYRIERFGLRNFFTVFFSSCFLGVRKPDEAIYRLALQMTQRPPQECLFIDDRPPNLECPRRSGMHTIHYQNPDQLRLELTGLGIEV